IVLFVSTHTRTTDISTLSLHDALPIFVHLCEAVRIASVGPLDARPPRFVRIRSRNHGAPGRYGRSGRLAGGAKVRQLLGTRRLRSEEHTSELQSRRDLVCRLLLEKKKK